MLARILSFFCMLGGLISLTGCSGVDLLNASIPRSGYSLHKDIAYGTGTRQKLDVYVPDGLTQPAPVVMFFYGGSWQMGSKDDYLFVGQALAEKGYVVVIADYRLYPEVKYPAFMQDSAQAFAWAHAHVGEYRGDAEKMFLAGHSAGAYNAVMLAANPVYLQEAGAKTSWIHGVIGIAGPYDFLPLTDPKLIALFGARDDITTQPIHYVNHPMPPVFLAAGEADTTVLPKNTYRLRDRLIALHSPVEVHTYPDVGHIGIALSLARGFRYKTNLLEEMDEFIKAKSNPHARP